MAVIYAQTATAAPSGGIQACSATALQTTNHNPKAASEGGTPSSTPVAGGGANWDSGITARFWAIEITPSAATTWAAGDWTIRVNITTADTCTWTATHICRVNSSGVSQATIGSLTGQSISLSTTGVKTMTVSGVSQTPSVGDRVYIVLTGSSQGANNSVSITPNQDIDSPFTAPATLNATLAVTESADVAAGTANLAHPATAAITESSDVAAGTVGFTRGATLAIDESSDVAAAAATVTHPITLAITEASDVASMTMDIGGEPATLDATLEVTEAADVFAALAILHHVMTLGDVDLVGDTVAMTAGVEHPAVLAITESGDIVAFAVSGAEPTDLFRAGRVPVRLEPAGIGVVPIRVEAPGPGVVPVVVTTSTDHGVVPVVISAETVGVVPVVEVP